MLCALTVPELHLQSSRPVSCISVLQLLLGRPKLCLPPVWSEPGIFWLWSSMGQTVMARLIQSPLLKLIVAVKVPRYPNLQVPNLLCEGDPEPLFCDCVFFIQPGCGVKSMGPKDIVRMVSSPKTCPLSWQG